MRLFIMLALMIACSACNDTQHEVTKTVYMPTVIQEKPVVQMPIIRNTINPVKMPVIGS